ncbi:MAG: DNA-binding transcriptional LysR family regulator [Spirosomataceae bacterium]
MEDFRLRVFYAVAKNKSFTKAADELFITQPAITKHIKLLEESLDVRLFDRRNHLIRLTIAGEVVFKYATEIFQLYEDAHSELSELKQQHKGRFRLGASTTIAQYLLSPVIASFFEKHPEIDLSLLNGNTEIIENAILANEIDLGIVEGKKHHSSIKYIDFVEDELVAVVHTNSRFAKLETITKEELKEIPLVLRERGSGTLDVLESMFKNKGIKRTDLKVIMNLGSIESIKSFLEYSNSMSFMSIRAVEREVARGEFKVVRIDGIKFLRKFSFIHLHGKPDKFSSEFILFYTKHYNKK